jgi:large subunit ribosomal protein L32
MAVPKKKTSKSKRDMRRSHLALGKTNVIIDKVSGEYRLPHHINPLDGTYNGRQVVIKRPEKESTDSE